MKTKMKSIKQILLLAVFPGIADNYFMLSDFLLQRTSVFTILCIYRAACSFGYYMRYGNQ